MWLFTKHGFSSAVCARRGNGKHGQPVDPGRIMVRAGVRGHLDALQSRFPDLLGGCEIQDSGGTDYAYRLFALKSVCKHVVAELVEETDYDNVKLGGRPPPEARTDLCSIGICSEEIRLGIIVEVSPHRAPQTRRCHQCPAFDRAYSIHGRSD